MSCYIDRLLPAIFALSCASFGVHSSLANVVLGRCLCLFLWVLAAQGVYVLTEILLAIFDALNDAEK